MTLVIREFGWTAKQGTWMIEGDAARERRRIETLQLGIDLGMTHIDTAEAYSNGRVEELVRETIAGKRNEVFLASKVLPSHASFEGTWPKEPGAPANAALNG